MTSDVEIIVVLATFYIAIWLIAIRFTVIQIVRAVGAAIVIYSADRILFRGLNSADENSLSWMVVGALLLLFGTCIIAISFFGPEIFIKKNADEEKSSESIKPP